MTQYRNPFLAIVATVEIDGEPVTVSAVPFKNGLSPGGYQKYLQVFPFEIIDPLTADGMAEFMSCCMIEGNQDSGIYQVESQETGEITNFPFWIQQIKGFRECGQQS